MCVTDKRENDRREQGIRNAELSIFAQRADLLRDLTKQLADRARTCVDTHIHCTALIIEINDLASKLNTVAYHSLLDRCMPPKNEAE